MERSKPLSHANLPKGTKDLAYCGMGQEYTDLQNTEGQRIMPFTTPARAIPIVTSITTCAPLTSGGAWAGSPKGI